jgi:hypothetical protein
MAGASRQPDKGFWAMAFKESHTVGRVTEITHIVPFKKGGPENSHGIRYADRCRIILEAFAKLESEGFVSPVRRFSGIHFARWTLIDADTRLLFTTNFDGTWEDYIGAFAREIPWSLGLIWSNCADYPADHHAPGDPDGALIPGADDYPLFSKFVKRFQVPTGLFYAHYGNLTVKDLRHLQIFHDEASKGLASDASVTLGEIERRTMDRTRDVDAAYAGLPAAPFPRPECMEPMSDADRAIYRARILPPIKELYGYDAQTMESVMAEFGLAEHSGDEEATR